MRTSLTANHFGSKRFCGPAVAVVAESPPLTASSARARSISSIPSSAGGAAGSALDGFFFFLLLLCEGGSGCAAAGKESESGAAAGESVGAALAFFFFFLLLFLLCGRCVSTVCDYKGTKQRTFAGAAWASSSSSGSSSSRSSPRSSCGRKRVSSEGSAGSNQETHCAESALCGVGRSSLVFIARLDVVLCREGRGGAVGSFEVGELIQLALLASGQPGSHLECEVRSRLWDDGGEPGELAGGRSSSPDIAPGKSARWPRRATYICYTGTRAAREQAPQGCGRRVPALSVRVGPRSRCSRRVDVRRLPDLLKGCQ